MKTLKLRAFTRAHWLVLGLLLAGAALSLTLPPARQWVRHRVEALSAALLFKTRTAATTPPTTATDLTGVWVATSGSMYYLRQIENTVWWAGFDPDPLTSDPNQPNVFHRGLSSSNLFQGTISGDTLTGDWADVPRQKNTLHNGTLTLQIIHSTTSGEIELRRQTQTGGFSDSSWTKTTIHLPPYNNNDGSRNLYGLFSQVIKNLSGETLLDPNLKPYKDNAVIFGTMARPLTLNFPGGTGFTCADFFRNGNSGDSDGDLDFDLQVDRVNLDAQPNFWQEGWLNDANDIQAKLTFWGNSLHGEAIMFGRPNTSCNPAQTLLPGWAETDANSTLWQGMPMNSSLVAGSGALVTLKGTGLPAGPGDRVRITGPIVLDCGHGALHNCNETQRDTKNLEIHPVYSIDVIQDFTHPRSANADLTGTWAASDVATYYVRQIGNTVWWLGLSRDQGRTFANVFRGTIQSKLIQTADKVLDYSTITGQWADVPLGFAQNDGELTLSGNFCPRPAIPNSACDLSKLPTEWNILVTQSTTNGIFSQYRWEKLYDRMTEPVPRIIVGDLDFGRAKSGDTVTRDLVVINIGTAPLVIQNIFSTDRAVEVAPKSLTIASGGQAHVSVTWSVTVPPRSVPYTIYATLSLVSNDLASPTTVVHLRLTLFGGPLQ